MTDKTDSKERDLMELVDAYAEARHIGGCHTYNAKTAAARNAVIAEIAASAGSEPVAYAMFADNGNIRLWSKAWIPHPDAKPLYLHPSPPEGMVGGWIALPGTLPKPGAPVLLDIGKKYPIRAMWAAKHTVEAADDDTDWGEYDEATDTYYCPEGWYEWNEHEDTNWAVSATPRAWATLPPTTSAGSRKGE